MIHKPGCPSPMMCLCYGPDSIYIPDPPRPPRPGDVYWWDAWSVVVVKNDDNGIVVVPSDGFSCYGLADIAVKDGDPLFIRCGRPVAILGDALEPERRYRELGPHHTRRLLRKMQQIATGPLDGSSEQWENEANPDYQHHMEDVTQFVFHLLDPSVPLPVMTE